jgi:glyoxylase-like metal-dependent hydrolase (beta-lactamase superfamily II)
MTHVVLLKPGFIVRDQHGNVLDASSSVTLVKSNILIIVDSGKRGEESMIRDALSKVGLHAEDIDLVVNTHSHEDHTGNNAMFSRAEIASSLSGSSVGDYIGKGVRIMRTAGHTMDSISVVAENVSSSLGTVVMAGDAIPTHNNFVKFVPPAIHVDREQAIESMRRIIMLARTVVPGHGQAFLIPEGLEVDLW